MSDGIKDSVPQLIGGFFGLGLPDVPPMPGSIWQSWVADGGLAITAWTARAALAQLIEATKPERVWLPAYLCRELASAAPSGALRLYPLDDELSPDVGFLQRHVQAGDVALAVDYFGWPPDGAFIELVADRPDVTWVEDRAHCLWTVQPPWASWILYSPHKLVGVADGGIVISRDGKGVISNSEPGSDASLAIPELMRFEDAGETNNARW